MARPCASVSGPFNTELASAEEARRPLGIGPRGERDCRPDAEHQTAGEYRLGLRAESLLGLRVFWYARIMFLSHGITPLFCLTTG